MSETFRGLVERYGVPYLVVPNTPRVLKNDRRGGRRSSLWLHTDPDTLPPIDVRSDVYHRISCGVEAFRLVSGILEINLADYAVVLAQLPQFEGVKRVVSRI